MGGQHLLPTLSTLLSLSLSSLRWPHHTDQAGLGLPEIRLPLPLPSKSFDSRCVAPHPVLCCPFALCDGDMTLIPQVIPA